MATILVVDDEQEIMFLTKRLLTKEGYEVIEAKNRRECFAAIEKMPPDLIILDVMISEDDGWEISKEIKLDEKTQDIPVLMFTVHTSPDSVEKSFKYALADGHINKPFKTDVFLELVKKFLKS